MADRTGPWAVFLGCFLLSVGVNAFIIAPSSITPLFVDRFAITATAAGNIVSAAIAGIVLTQIPGGYLLDRYDNRWLLGLTTGGFVLVALASQGDRSFEVFLGLRVVGGVLAGFVQTTGVNVVGQIFPTDRQGFATGLFFASPPVAFAFAHVTSPPLGVAFGPLRVFLLHAAIAVTGLAVFRLAAVEPLSGPDTPGLGEYVRALGNRSVILVGLSGSTAFALYIFLNSWLPTYGRDVLSLSLAVSGVLTAAVPLVSIPARPVGGWLSTRLGNRRRPVLGGGLLAGVVLLVAVPFTDGLPVFVVIVVGTGFCAQLGIGLYYTYARELATAGTEGTSLTVLTTISFVGSFVAPAAGGWLVANHSWTTAFLAFAGAGLVGVLLLVPVPEPVAGSGALTTGGDD